MGSPALFGKLAAFEASLRKPALIPFGLFNVADNLGFIANMPGQGTTFSQASEAYASNLVIDTSSADIITVLLTGNVASMALNYAGSGTIPSGQRNWLRLLQDATGGRTVAFPSNLLLDTNFQVDLRASRATVFAIEYQSSAAKWVLFEEPFSVPTA